ncbi:MAG: dTMP kinase [Microbacterium gubbeenense]
MTDGLWITFEGGDGTGKTTQAELLREWFEQQGRAVLLTREPGGTEAGKTIREIVLHSRGELDDRTEALLFAADRAHHIHTIVRPALERGEVVIQDRYLDSSVAYQGAARALGADEVRELSLWATGGALPDVTVLLDLDPAVARRRLDADDKPFDRLEAEKAEFHTRVRDAFLALAAAEPERFLVIDATLPREEIQNRIRERIRP